MSLSDCTIKQPKCVIWDLDETVWEGTLLEGDDAQLRSGIREMIVELDSRGILNSIASRSDNDAAQARLVQLGIHDYFVFPQVGWGAKSDAIVRIADAIGSKIQVAVEERGSDEKFLEMVARDFRNTARFRV